jgi:hypothetical protein
MWHNNNAALTVANYPCMPQKRNSNLTDDSLYKKKKNLTDDKSQEEN